MKFFDSQTVIQLVSILVGLAIAWSKIDNTVSNIKDIRSQDIQRIEKLEAATKELEKDIGNIEKHNIELSTDIKYIKETLKDIANTLKTTQKQ